MRVEKPTVALPPLIKAVATFFPSGDIDSNNIFVFESELSGSGENKYTKII